MTLRGVAGTAFASALFTIALVSPLLASPGNKDADVSVTDAATKTHDETDRRAHAKLASPPVSELLARLQVKGFLTQAYATGKFQDGRLPGNRGPTEQETILGIPEDGTTDYRNIAIQFRYDISKADAVVIRLRNRSLGFSPITDVEDDVELGRGFYEHRFRDGTSIRIGRAPVPYGIFNEDRDVGTSLPFYRAPFSFYGEASLTSETVDGLVASHVFMAGKPWSVETDVYWGEWDSVELDPVSNDVLAARNKNAFGGQSWLNTPAGGLRFGLGFQQRDTEGGAEGIYRQVGEATRSRDWFASVDSVILHFVVRAEYLHRSQDGSFPLYFGETIDSTLKSWYAQVGYPVTNRFHVYLQSEKTNVANDASVFTEPQNFTQRMDNGVALNFRFKPSVVLKAEHHWVSGEDQGFEPLFTTQAFRLQPVYSDLKNGNYSIVSLSVSF